MLRTYRTYNSTAGFPNYDFYNKLLVGVTHTHTHPKLTYFDYLNKSIDHPELRIIRILI